MYVCISCNENEVYIMKSMLCKKCYFAAYYASKHTEVRKNKRFVWSNNPKCDNEGCSSFRSLNTKQPAELIFEKKFPDSILVYQPCRFRLNDDRTNENIFYTPDFYDATRNVFIEIARTHQGFYASKHRYCLFIDKYPLLQFEIYTPDGEQRMVND